MSGGRRLLRMDQKQFLVPSNVTVCALQKGNRGVPVLLRRTFSVRMDDWGFANKLSKRFSTRA